MGGRASAQTPYSFSGLGDLPGGNFSSQASGISADGSVVVGFGSSSSSRVAEAFRWTEEGGMVGLGDLPGGQFRSSAYGISADGSVVVGVGNLTGSGSAPSEAFRWTESGGMVGLGSLPGGGSQSFANGTSADGSVVVGSGNSSSGTEAFRWTESGGMVGLGDLPGGIFGSLARDVSADGSVVVGNSSIAWDETIAVGTNETFVWDETNGMRALIQILADQGIDMTGWNLSDATGISADGLTIVGTGTNPLGFTEAWIATIPEPSTALMLALGITGIAARQRHHRRSTTRRD